MKQSRNIKVNARMCSVLCKPSEGYHESCGTLANSDDWYTPPFVFTGLGCVFDLDVASPEGGLSWIPTKDIFTKKTDGLRQDWHGIVWCNPPYSAPSPWCHKWATHANGLLLIRADLSTKGPFIAFTAATSMWVSAGRLAFVNGAGTQTSSTTFTTVLLGAGKVADVAIARLATSSGGIARMLT